MAGVGTGFEGGTEHNGSTSLDSVILGLWVSVSMAGTAGSCCVVRLVLGEVVDTGKAPPVCVLKFPAADERVISLGWHTCATTGIS